MVLIKGWVLDPVQVAKIELYVDDQFLHQVNKGLPRIDVLEAYPNYPGIHNIAPGFQSGFTASRFSNGPHTVMVKVYFADGRVFELGRRTINIDNTLNQTPFGSLDIPDQAAQYNASGSFPVSGWAADTDGIGRVDVMIDGGILQSAMYGDPRPDVANTFPDLPAAAFSAFVANIDTTRIQDGVHLLEVVAYDRLGLSKLIGRRQVQIFNEESNLKPFGYLDEPLRDAVLYGTRCTTTPVIISPPVNPQSHITPVRGWALDLGTRSDLGRVSYVELMIDGVRWVSTDDCNFSTLFNTFTNCYGLPRFDVQRYYPTYPDAPRSGYMFTLDVGALIALGVRQGSHVLKVRVGDQQQTFAELPGPQGIPVFFECAENRVAAVQGFIDIPTQFDYVKGNVTFQGWAANERNNILQVEILVDGNFIGVAQYGFPRPDVQQANPFLNNALNSGWRFTMDTTKLSNARHRLTVRVLDNQNLRTEIGSVDFYVQNTQQIP
jgi:N-acetylmuramoyl-L-alanine amidase